MGKGSIEGQVPREQGLESGVWTMRPGCGLKNDSNAPKRKVVEAG